MGPMAGWSENLKRMETLGARAPAVPRAFFDNLIVLTTYPEAPRAGVVYT